MLFKPQPLISPVQIETSMALPARHHNYAVSGGMCNAFAVGAIGAEADFWLVAGEPPSEGEGASLPLLYANLLDGFGRRLLTLAANRPTYNPKGCSVQAETPGLRVLAADGQEVLRVDTVWVKAMGYHVSYFHCRLKDRAGVIRMESRGASDQPSAAVHGRAAFGVRPNGTFARNDGLSEEQVHQAMVLLHLPDEH